MAMSSNTQTHDVDKVYQPGQPHDFELCDCDEHTRSLWIFRRAKFAKTGFWGCPNWSMSNKGCGSLNERAMKQRILTSALAKTRMSQSIVQTRSFWEPMIFFPPIQSGSTEFNTIATIKEPKPSVIEQEAIQWISRTFENKGHYDANHLPMNHETSGLWSKSFLMVHFQSAAIRHYCQYDLVVQADTLRLRVHIQPLWFKSWLAIEVIGFGGNGHVGWLYGDADVVMFQLQGSDDEHPIGRWILVHLHRLRQWFHDPKFLSKSEVAMKSWLPRTNMTTQLPEQFDTDFDMPEHRPFDVELSNMDPTKIYRGSLADPALKDDYLFIHQSQINILLKDAIYDINALDDSM